MTCWVRQAELLTRCISGADDRGRRTRDTDSPPGGATHGAECPPGGDTGTDGGGDAWWGAEGGHYGDPAGRGT